MFVCYKTIKTHWLLKNSYCGNKKGLDVLVVRSKAGFISSYECVGMAQYFKGNSGAGLEGLQQRGQVGLETGACILPEHMPLSENLGMLLKLRYSLTACPDPCWS